MSGNVQNCIIQIPRLIMRCSGNERKESSLRKKQRFDSMQKCSVITVWQRRSPLLRRKLKEWRWKKFGNTAGKHPDSTTCDFLENCLFLKYLQNKSRKAVCRNRIRKLITCINNHISHACVTTSIEDRGAKMSNSDLFLNQEFCPQIISVTYSLHVWFELANSYCSRRIPNRGRCKFIFTLLCNTP